MIDDVRGEWLGRPAKVDSGFLTLASDPEACPAENFAALLLGRFKPRRVEKKLGGARRAISLGPASIRSAERSFPKRGRGGGLSSVRESFRLSRCLSPL